MTIRRNVSVLVAVLVIASCTGAQADLLSVEASDNATVQPAGPRAGGSGKAFFNVEGSVNGTFASYGVADFSFGVLPMNVIGVSAMQLALTQANAAFSAAGPVVLSLDQSATLADIQPGTSPLAFDGADPGTTTDVGQGDLSLLALGGGPFNYAVGASGDVDTYTIVLNPSSAAELINRLNNADPIRVVVGTGDAALAGTWAGHTNTTFTGPTLHLEVQFEDGTPSESRTWGRIKAAYR